MKKQKLFKNYKFWLIIFAIVLITSLALNFGKFQGTFTGFSTLSLSQVDLSSANEGFFTGEAWVLTFTQGAVSQYAIGDTIPADEIEDDGERATNDFKMDIDWEKQECKYTIHPDTFEKKIYTDTRIVARFATPSGCANDIQANNEACGSQDALLSGMLLRCNIVCGTERTAMMGDYESPLVNQKFTIKVYKNNVLDGQKTFETLSKSKKGIITDNVGIVYQGSFVTGEVCKDKDEYKPAYVSGKWVNLKDDAYREYVNHLNNEPDTRQMEWWADELERLGKRALDEEPFADSYIQSTSIENAIVIRQLDSPIQNPVVTAYIKADWLGIYTRTGKPQIVSAENFCFGSSSDGKIKVEVKNIGDEGDYINVFADCPSPFDAYNSDEQFYEPNQQKTIYLSLSGEANEKTIKTCTVYAETFENEDTETVEVCVEPFLTCEIGEEVCRDNKRYTCNDKKTAIDKFVEDCGGNTCTYINDIKTQCEAGGNGNGGISILDKIKDWFNNLFTKFQYALIIGSVLAGLIAMLVAYLVTNEKFPDNKVVVWTLSIIVGIIGGLLLFFLWWLWVILIVILIIVKQIARRMRL